MTPGARSRAALAAARARLERRRSWLLAATLALGLAGWSFAALVYGSGDPEARALRLAGGLAAASVGAPAWYLLVTRSGRHTLPRGAAVGALAGVFSYPLFWTYGLALAEIAKGRPEGALAGLGVGFLFGVTVGLFGLLFAPFTCALGATTGLVVALIARPFVGTGGRDGGAGRTEHGGAGEDEGEDRKTGGEKKGSVDGPVDVDPADPTARERAGGPESDDRRDAG